MTDSSCSEVPRLPRLPRSPARGARAAILAFVGLAAAVVTGCPGTLQDPERFLGDDAAPGSGTCPDVQATILQGTCAASGCHSTTDKQQGLDLQSPDLDTRLVNVPTTEGTGLLIDPNNPQASALYTKLTASPPFGARMPFGQQPLNAATIACVLDWITTQLQPADAGAAGDDGSEPPPGNDATIGLSDGSGTMPVMDATTTPPKDAGAVMDARAGHRDSGAMVDATSSQPEAAAPVDASDAGDDAD